MWFGHGTGPGKSEEGPFGPTEDAARIAAVIYGAIAALPAALRARAAARNNPATRENLAAAMTAWARGSALDHDEFAERFFGRAVDDPVVGDLRAAAMGAAMAGSHADLAETVGHLADAMQTVGLDHWQSFAADAVARAQDPATVAAVADSLRPLPEASGKDGDGPVASAASARVGDSVNVMVYAKPPSLSELMKRNDSVAPVYPIETLAGIAAAGIAAGGAAVARAVGGAILKQILPKSGSPVDTTTQGNPL
jgi:hypothetical protein